MLFRVKIENSDEFLVQKKNPLLHLLIWMSSSSIRSKKKIQRNFIDDSDKIKKALNIESNKTEDNNNTNNKNIEN